jgi:hypothetical protein
LECKNKLNDLNKKKIELNNRIDEWIENLKLKPKKEKVLTQITEEQERKFEFLYDANILKTGNFINNEE